MGVWVHKRCTLYENGKERGHIRLSYCFNGPEDVYAFRRKYETLMENAISRITPIAARDGLTIEGNAIYPGDSATLTEVENMIHDTLNQLFHCKVYETCFKKMKRKPFSYTGEKFCGRFYFEQVSTALFMTFNEAIKEQFGR